MWLLKLLPKPQSESRGKKGALPGALLPDKPNGQVSLPQKPVCRICWAEQDKTPGGKLVSPCSCAGSVKYVHKRCLKAWQRVLEQNGAYSKTLKCDICNSAYNSNWDTTRRFPESIQELVSLVIKEIWGALSWTTLFRLYKSVVLVTGAVQAARFGADGLTKGIIVGVTLMKPVLLAVAKYTPHFALLSLLCPFLQLPTFIGMFAVGLGVSLVLALPCIMGLYCGGLYGFFSGSIAAVQLTKHFVMTVVKLLLTVLSNRQLLARW